MTKILLVGCGKMGGALLAGWLDRGIAPDDVVVIRPSAGAASASLPVRQYAAPDLLPADFSPDIVLLAVKPQMMEGALPPYRRFEDAVFLSIAAGKTLAYFEARLGDGKRVVRAMPNTPAAVRRGITVATANSRVNPAERALCGDLLAAVGEIAWVEEESQIDAVTALSGSGPAYVFLLVESLTAAGIAAGLPEELAARLARATVVGSGELLRLSPETPATLRQNVTSPGGTTFAALQVLMGEGGLTPLLTEAVAAAARRSRELAG